MKQLSQNEVRQTEETLLLFRKSIMFQDSCVGVDVRVGKNVKRRWLGTPNRLKPRGEYSQSI